MDNFIQLKKDNILRIGIKTVDGKETGEHLEFDLEDIELPIRLNKCNEMHKSNLRNLKNQIFIIDKKQDKRGKQLLSANEEEKIKVVQKFCIEEMKALDLFLGENGTAKLLNGRKPYFSMFDDISEILKPIMPMLETTTQSITDKIKAKYSTTQSDVISNE